MADDHEVDGTAPVDPLPGIFNAGFLSLFSGASGIGKTALIAHLARCFRDGAPIAGHPTNQVPVGYITGDRPWDDSQQWFDAVGFPDIRQYSVVDDDQFDLTQLGKRGDGAAALQSCLDRLQMPGPGIVFVDPIALFLGGNLLDYNTVAIGCIKLHRKISKRTRFPHCLVGVCHTSKQKADTSDRYLRPQDRISGSGALNGFSATQMNLMAPDEIGNGMDQYHCYLNPHHRKAETWYLTKDDQTGLFTFVKEMRRSDEDQLNDRLLSIHAMLTDPPTVNTIPSIMRLTADLALTPRTLNRYLHALQKAGYVRHLGRSAWQKVLKP